MFVEIGNQEMVTHSGTRRACTVHDAKMPIKIGFQRKGCGYVCPLSRSSSSGGLWGVNNPLMLHKATHQAKVTSKMSPIKNNRDDNGTTRYSLLKDRQVAAPLCQYRSPSQTMTQNSPL